jgi:maltose-binding protein MalE
VEGIRMKIKNVIAFVISAAMLLSFAGCGKTDTAVQGSTAQNTAAQSSTQETKKFDVTLTVWHNFMPELAKVIKEQYDQFTKDTGIKLEFIKQEDCDKKIENAAQNGGLPDLIMRANDLTGKLATMGAIAPVDEVVDKSVLDGLMQNAIDGFKYKGKLYGIPSAIETVALIYNKDLIKEAPKTTDELLAKAKELTKDGKYGFLIPPKDPYYNSAFFLGGGGGFLSSDAKPILNSAENIETENASGICKALSEGFGASNGFTAV